jgi:hypothetical protein
MAIISKSSPGYDIEKVSLGLSFTLKTTAYSDRETAKRNSTTGLGILGISG